MVVARTVEVDGVDVMAVARSWRRMARWDKRSDGGGIVFGGAGILGCGVKSDEAGGAQWKRFCKERVDED